jgi:hypothetical protein
VAIALLPLLLLLLSQSAAGAHPEVLHFQEGEEGGEAGAGKEEGGGSDTGEDVTPTDDFEGRGIPEVLTEDEPEEEPKELDEVLKTEGALSEKHVQKYAAKKLENVRIALTVFNFMWVEMKEGDAGWGHYDDLFSTHAIFSNLTVGGVQIPIPTGGMEISYIGMPLYQLCLGAFYEVYTGERHAGNRFDDLIISNIYVGLRINLFNEYTALQLWGEMFEFDRPKHFLGINIYLKGAAILAIYNRVKYRGNSATGAYDTYFNQTEVGGYMLLAGFEYRFYTCGLFFETGWKFIKKPEMARPLMEPNHFRSFPVIAGFVVYFGG